MGSQMKRLLGNSENKFVSRIDVCFFLPCPESPQMLFRAVCIMLGLVKFAGSINMFVFSDDPTMTIVDDLVKCLLFGSMNGFIIRKQSNDKKSIHFAVAKDPTS